MTPGAMPVPVSDHLDLDIFAGGMPLRCRRTLSSALTLLVRIVTCPPLASRRGH